MAEHSLEGYFDLPDDPFPTGWEDMWADLHPCLRSALALHGIPDTGYAAARYISNNKHGMTSEEREELMRIIGYVQQ